MPRLRLPDMPNVHDKPIGRSADDAVNWEKEERQPSFAVYSVVAPNFEKYHYRAVSLDSEHLFPAPQEVEELFYKLRAEWVADTRMKSNAIAILMHPAYYRIIGLGQEALPYIFEDLKKGGGPWYVALDAITRQDVGKGIEGDAKMLRERWIEWGKANGYIR
jgi:hypothetical protein